MGAGAGTADLSAALRDDKKGGSGGGPEKRIPPLRCGMTKRRGDCGRPGTADLSAALRDDKKAGSAASGYTWFGCSGGKAICVDKPTYEDLSG